MDNVFQKCISKNCGRTYSVTDVLHRCPDCGNLLDVEYEWDKLNVPKELRFFESRWSDRRNGLNVSGVWRFRELLPFASEDYVVTVGEGQTILQHSPGVGKYINLQDGLYLQYEGLNPSGSFKDNGMTAAFTHANMVGAKHAACASTGNTSASLALFSAVSKKIDGIVFIGSGKIAFGKLAQALDYGAKTLQIQGDFDDAMKHVQEASTKLKLYLMNSLNPFRLEGQKAIMYRVLEGLNWEVPDWIVVPGGNLGNSSAFGKAFQELFTLGLIKRKPRIAIINSTGANTLYTLVEKNGLRWNGGDVDDAVIGEYYDNMDKKGLRARTIASAIEINRPVNLKKALRSLEYCNGVVREVTDEEILNAKAQVGRNGFGCEPASAASVAGAKLLRSEGIIASDERVVCILTGHSLKDPNVTVNYHSLDETSLAEKYKEFGVHAAAFDNKPIQVENNIDKIIAILEDNIFNKNK